MYLKPKEKLKFIRIYKKEGILVARTKYIKKYSDHYNYKRRSDFTKDITRLIKKWTKLYDTYGMARLKRNKGIKNKKPIAPEIIWERLEEKEKLEIFKDWLKKERERSKKQQMISQNQFKDTIKQKRRSEIWMLSKQGIINFRKRGFTNKKLNSGTQIKRERIYKICLDYALVVDGKVNFRAGREKVQNSLKRLYNIKLSPRMVGYHMKSLNSQSKVRRPNQFRQKREDKDVSQDTKNLTNRDYNRPNTYSIDVKYIEHRNIYGNHIFPSLTVN